ncbi:MAG: hypothetical protein Q9200_003788 [Gallowayella weberi]
MPQEVIAQGMVLLTRFYLGPEGGSFRINSAKTQESWAYSPKDVSAASLFIAAKMSADPQTPRSICNVYAYLMSAPTREAFPRPPAQDPESYYLSEGSYHSARVLLLQAETIVLRTLSFNTKVILPHHIALTYLQTLGVFPPTPSLQSHALAARTLRLLNLALFSPQIPYITHPPATLAVAAIYLAAREVGVKLPSNEWWEIFDVDREDLGFLVITFQSCESWIKGEREKWHGRICPLSVDEVESELRA